MPGNRWVGGSGLSISDYRGIDVMTNDHLSWQASSIPARFNPTPVRVLGKRHRRGCVCCTGRRAADVTLAALATRPRDTRRFKDYLHRENTTA